MYQTDNSKSLYSSVKSVPEVNIGELMYCKELHELGMLLDKSVMRIEVEASALSVGGKGKKLEL